MSKINLFFKDLNQYGTPINEIKKKTHDILNFLIGCSFGESHLSKELQIKKYDVFIEELEELISRLKNNQEIFRIYIDGNILECNCYQAVQALKLYYKYVFIDLQKLAPSLIFSIFNKSKHDEKIELEDNKMDNHQITIRYDGLLDKPFTLTSLRRSKLTTPLPMIKSVHAGAN